MNTNRPRNSIILPGSSALQGQDAERLILLQADGTPFPLTPDTQKLTGYTMAGSKQDLAATDTVLQALGKLEKRLALLSG